MSEDLPVSEDRSVSEEPDPPARLPVGRRRKPADPAQLKRLRRIGLTMIGVGGLILLAGAWLVVTGLLARSQLQSVRAEVHQLRDQLTSGDVAGARKTLSALQTHAHRAHQLTTGPVWALASGLPEGGEPVRTVRGITASVDALAARALPTLIDVRHKLDTATLRHPDGRIDLTAITAVRPSLDRADAVMSAATRSINGLPKRTWLGPVDRARTDLLEPLRDLARDVRTADLAVRIAPPILGADGIKRYFVGFQNNAEARGTGGLPGAFGILEITDGLPHFTRFENDSRLGLVRTDLDFGADYRQLYEGDATTSQYVNSNVSPNFPYVAKIWTTMWEQASGQHLDGAFALDPGALSYLLAVTGPATLPGGSRVESGNVVELTQSTAYAKFAADVVGRKAYLLAIAKAASTRIVENHGSTAELVKAAARAVGERRLLMWSADPAVQSELEQTSAAGAVPDTAQPFAGPVVINGAGNKLDYYLNRSFTWQRSGCGSTRKVSATVTLTNDAPAAGLPIYVTARGDRHGYRVRPGDNRVDLDYFATRGALLDSVTVDGKPGTVGSGVERGHPVYIVNLELPRGATRTVVFHLTEPAGSGALQVLRQPLVRPLNVTIDDAKCG